MNNLLTPKQIEMRIITTIKLPLTLLIAFIPYYFFPSKVAYWSLVTIVAIAQAGIENTFSKSTMRVIGTLAGAILGYILALLFDGKPVLVAIVFSFATFATSLFAVQRANYSYAGIIAGVTLVIILSSHIEHMSLMDVTWLRTLEVLFGVLLLLLVNGFLLSIYRHNRQHLPYILRDLKCAIPHRSFLLDKNTLLIAFKIALATTFTFIFWLIFKQPGGFWATITCFLIMEENVNATQNKAILRILAHIIAAGVGVVWALLFGEHEWTLIFPLAIGGAICGYLISRKDRYSSLGNTLGIALIVMLLAAPGTVSTIHVIFARFLNVVLGITLAILTMRYGFRSNRTIAKSN